MKSVVKGVSFDFPRELARRYGVVPSRDRGRGALVLLAPDPGDFQVEDDLRFALGREVELVAAPPERLAPLLEEYLSQPKASLVSNPVAGAAGLPLSAAGAQRRNEDASASSWGADVLRAAVEAGASDLHFEPFGDELIVRRRVDGVLSLQPSPAPEIAGAVAYRLKVLANLDIAERRRPQDGRIRCEGAGRTVDVRMSTLPTQFGESIVLRVLDPSALRLGLGDLGMTPGVLEGVRAAITRPHGLFVVTGPTSSGKTTSLYCALQELNVPGSKLLTVEDPVEYEIDGAMQVNVNPAAGLTFASALRSFLRHDPDVVMVGEIRDAETARIAVQAALTGHVVLATLHTNDAPSAVARLADLGIEPFLIASALEGVLAQRLVRRVCRSCPPPGPGPAEGPAGPGSPGCPACHGSGYRGRTGIFEWMPIGEQLRDLIGAGAPVHELRRHATAHGLRPLRDEGLRLVAEGSTTMEEVLRCS